MTLETRFTTRGVATLNTRRGTKFNPALDLQTVAIVQQNLVSLPNIFSFLLPKPLVKQLVNLS